METDIHDKLDCVLRRLDELAAKYGQPDQRFLGIAAASRYAGLSQESVRRLLAAGKIKALRPVRGRVVIDKRELDAYMTSNTAVPRVCRGRIRRN